MDLSVVPVTCRLAGPPVAGGGVGVGAWWSALWWSALWWSAWCGRVVVGGGRRWRRGGRIGWRSLTARVLHLDVVDDHRHTRFGGRERATVAVQFVRECPADGDVQNDEVAGMVREIGPGLRRHLVLVDREGQGAIEVPPQLIGRSGSVPLDRIGVESRLAGRDLAGLTVVAGFSVVDSLRLIARTAPGAAMQHVVGPIQALNILHDVEFTDSWP